MTEFIQGLLTGSIVEAPEFLQERRDNGLSQWMASQSAAPVCHKQNPILMAPPNNRTIFQGMSSRSLIVRILKTKNRIVATRITALLSRFCARAGMNDRMPITAMAEKMTIKAMISFRVTGPSLL